MSIFFHEEVGIGVRNEADSLDISLYEARTLNDDAAKAMPFTDALIPAEEAIADATVQYGRAIVEFPDGKG